MPRCQCLSKQDGVSVCVCVDVGGCVCLKFSYIIHEIHTKLSIFCSRGSSLTDGTCTCGIHSHILRTAEACYQRSKYSRCWQLLGIVQIIITRSVSFWKPIGTAWIIFILLQFFCSDCWSTKNLHWPATRRHYNYQFYITGEARGELSLFLFSPFWNIWNSFFHRIFWLSSVKNADCLMDFWRCLLYGHSF